MNDPRALLPLTSIATPADEAGVAEAIGRAGADRIPVYPIGGGTQLGFGARPSEPGLGLSLAGLTRVIDYPARDLTITVEAGITLAALAQCLAAENQRLPVDVPLPAQATVGGAVAAGMAGPRQLRWGTLRDYVIGLRAVDGTGTAFSAGGRVVKNAAGYDLCRLLTGSLGTLGVIVQATLMVKPMPQASAFVACELPDTPAAEKLLAQLVHTQTLPAAVELLCGPAWQHDPALPPLSRPESLRLLVGLEGSAAEVDWMIGRLNEEWRQAGMTSPQVVTGAETGPLWSRLTDFAALPSNGPNPWLVVQIHVLPSAVIHVVEGLRSICPDVSIQSHAANGMVVARLPIGDKDAAGLIDGRLRPWVNEVGGYLVVLAQPDGASISLDTLFGPPPPGSKIMHSIRQRFDPAGILNRGRFGFGLPAP